jgi:hypothetical protein
METKLRQNKMERVRIKLGFPSMFVVESVGRSGGLALFWSSEVVMEIINFSRRHIYAKVLTAGRGLLWKLTSFYGHPEASKRHEAWSLLRFLASLTPSRGSVWGISTNYWTFRKNMELVDDQEP